MLDHEPKNIRIARLFWTFLLAIAGMAHFLVPEFFLQYMPNYLPVPDSLIGMTGLLEWMLAASLWRPVLRHKTWLGLAILLTLYLPVHVYLITDYAHLSQSPFSIPKWLAWLRLFVQFFFIGWTWRLYKQSMQISAV